MMLEEKCAKCMIKKEVALYAEELQRSQEREENMKAMMQQLIYDNKQLYAMAHDVPQIVEVQDAEG